MAREYSTLAIDSLNVFKACYATAKDLRTKNGFATGGMIGFLNKLRNLQAKYQTDKIYILWEGGSSWRKEVSPIYKGTRIKEENPDEANQIPALSNMLRIIPGVVNVHVIGYEADDVAGDLFSLHEEGISGNLLLVSNDKDWLQLVGEYSDVLRFSSGKLVNLENFSEHADGANTPEEFLEMKCIMGDAGDNVPGVENVGPNKALKYLRGQLNTNTVAYARISEWMENPEGYALARSLMDLRTDIQLENKPWVEYFGDNPDQFFELCEIFEFNSILRRKEYWLDVFPK